MLHALHAYVRRGLRRTPAPLLVEGEGTLDLRFEQGVGQSRMDLAEPDLLVVDYTRTMLAALLWQPRPARIGLVGMGGGSQLKFCHRFLAGAAIEAVEIDARVIALRARFRIPPDDARLCVVHADARRLLPQRQGAYDLLLVDAYDATGIPAPLSTTAFYRACLAALAPGGAMAVNLFCADHAVHAARLRTVFAGRIVVVEEPSQDNRVAIAWRDPRGPAWQPDVDAALAALAPVARAQLRAPMERVADACVRPG